MPTTQRSTAPGNQLARWPRAARLRELARAKSREPLLSRSPSLNEAVSYSARRRGTGAVTLADWALLASVVFSGLWSGLLAMLTMVMHPMLRAMSGRDFARFLRAFLPPARHAPFNYVAVVGMVIAPAVALVALDIGSTSFVLTAIGLALTILGPLLVSNRMAEPNYDVMLAWDPEAMPSGWEATRKYYFTLNWVRAFATWVAFGLLLAALVVELL